MKRNTAIALAYWLVLTAIPFIAGRVANTSIWFYLLGATYVLLLWCFLPIVRFVERRPLTSLGLRFNSPLKVILWGAMAFIVGLFIHTGGTAYEVYCLGKDLLLATPIVSKWLLEILQQILWVSFPEEVSYRGYLLTRLRESWGSVPALLLSAILFGVAHLGLGDWSQAIATVLFGLLYGVVFLKTENVYASTLAHMLENLFGNRIVRGVFLLLRG